MDTKEQMRLRKQKQRDRERDKSSKDVTLSVDNVTQDVTQYHPIMYALTDPIKREKLERIVRSLREFEQARSVYYGLGKNSIPMDVVGDYLDATK